MTLHPTLPDAAGFILAGGRSSRMGQDKALIPLANRPLIAHTLAILSEAGIPASIAGGSPSLAAFASLVPDQNPGQGPLSGICAALSSTTAEYSIFLTVDAPFIPASLLTVLLNYARLSALPIVIPSLNGQPQTFPAVIHRTALPALHAELVATRLRCSSAFQSAACALAQPLAILSVESLVQCGQLAHPAAQPPFRWFLNLNRPDDLCHARSAIA